MLKIAEFIKENGIDTVISDNRVIVAPLLKHIWNERFPDTDVPQIIDADEFASKVLQDGCGIEVTLSSAGTGKGAKTEPLIQSRIARGYHTVYPEFIGGDHVQAELKQLLAESPPGKKVMVLINDDAEGRLDPMLRHVKAALGETKQALYTGVLLHTHTYTRFKPNVRGGIWNRFRKRAPLSKDYSNYLHAHLIDFSDLCGGIRPDTLSKAERQAVEAEMTSINEQLQRIAHETIHPPKPTIRSRLRESYFGR